MNNNAPQYPYANQYGYAPPVTYAPTQTYPYPPPQQLQGQLPVQQQQQQIPHVTQQHQHQQFFPNQLQAQAPHATPPRRPQQQQQQQIAGGVQHGQRSVPPTPGNGPGAPPPEPNSPPEANYEEELMNALRAENEARVPAGSNTIAATSNNTNTVVNVDEDDDDDDEAMGDDNDDGPVYQLPPPPEAIYPDEIELEKAMHAWSLEHGYELVRRASKKNAAKQLYKRYFHCSKHGKVSSKAVRKEDRKRVNRTSNRMNCPMSLAAVAVDPHDPTGNWQIRHRKTHHNHPAIDVVNLAGHRRRARNPAVEAAVDGLFAIGTNVGDVLKFLQRTNPDGLFKRTDVANMKLKYKKYGTCTHHGDETANEARASKAAGASSNVCSACRVKKTQCNNARPICDVCATSDTPCHYDGDPSGNASAGAEATQESGVSQNADVSMLSQSGDATNLPNNNNNIIPGLNMQNTLQASRVLAALSSFQQEHVRPTKLTLESSAVEILAASTCGNGSSYKSSIERPFAFGGDYAAFKEAFLSAAMKENTSEVLMGVKREPVKPVGVEGKNVEVEDHNEYVKQLAIYKRRNDMLKAGLRETLAPALWKRVAKQSHAYDAWCAIEDLCMPRGSDQAYTRFSALSDVTLERAGGNLDNYIHQLETKFQEFNQMAACHEARRAPAALNQSNSEVLKRRAGGDGTYPEELLCFTFLKGLGPQYQGLAANLCKRNNVGGFGSGERLTFKELTLLVKSNLEARGGGSR